jgi:hypothetical protein
MRLKVKWLKFTKNLFNRCALWKIVHKTSEIFFNLELSITPDDEPFRDYLRLIDRETRQDMGYPKLYFSDFVKNQHHSKETV